MQSARVGALEWIVSMDLGTGGIIYVVKKTQYPINMHEPGACQILLPSTRRPDGGLAASLRYLSQRYHARQYDKGLLNDIGTEELSHLEMIGT